MRPWLPAAMAVWPAVAALHYRGSVRDEADEADEADDLAGALARHLASVSFAGQDADHVTKLLIDAVADWAKGRGWRVYRRARSVMTIPFGGHSTVDVGIARACKAPIVVEVDRSDRQRTVEKLVAEANVGRVALWVRWGAGEFATPPLPVRLVACPVLERRGSHGRKLFSSADHALEPPEHSPLDVTGAEQADLF